MNELKMAAARLSKSKDFATVLHARMEELVALMLATDPADSELPRYLIQYHGLREFGDYVHELGKEVKYG